MAYFIQTCLPDHPRHSSIGFWGSIYNFYKRSFSLGPTHPPSVMGWPTFFKLASRTLPGPSHTLLYRFLGSIYNFCKRSFSLGPVHPPTVMGWPTFFKLASRTLPGPSRGPPGPSQTLPDPSRLYQTLPDSSGPSKTL